MQRTVLGDGLLYPMRRLKRHGAVEIRMGQMSKIKTEDRFEVSTSPVIRGGNTYEAPCYHLEKKWNKIIHMKKNSGITRRQDLQIMASDGESWRKQDGQLCTDLAPGLLDIQLQR